MADVENEQEPLGKSEFWMRAATWSFGVWAILLSIVGWLVARGIESLLKSDEQTRQELRIFVIQSEHRLTQVEKDNERDRARLDKLEQRIDRR